MTFAERLFDAAANLAQTRSTPGVFLGDPVDATRTRKLAFITHAQLNIETHFFYVDKFSSNEF